MWQGGGVPVAANASDRHLMLFGLPEGGPQKPWPIRDRALTAFACR